MAMIEIVFYRYLLCLPLLIIYGRWTLREQFLRINNVPILILRSIFGFLGLSFWFFGNRLYWYQSGHSIGQYNANFHHHFIYFDWKGSCSAA